MSGFDWALMLGLYFLPAIVAAGRGHNSGGAIFLLNLLLGWTVLGWIIALVWAATGNVSKHGTATPQTHVKCPDCAELVLRDARVCKHCGCKLRPYSDVPELTTEVRPKA